MPVGPSIMQFPSKVRVCTLCDFFESKLKISGRNPTYQYLCNHSAWSKDLNGKRVIGDNHSHPHSETPMWCPVLYERYKSNPTTESEG